MPFQKKFARDAIRKHTKNGCGKHKVEDKDVDDAIDGHPQLKKIAAMIEGDIPADVAEGDATLIKALGVVYGLAKTVNDAGKGNRLTEDVEAVTGLVLRNHAN